MKLKAIVFDLDGVLVDSMPTHVRTWTEAFENVAGLRVTDRDIYLNEGMRGIELAVKLLEGRKAGSDLAGKVVDEKNRIFRSIGSSVPFEGIPALLRRLKSPKVVVSGSARQDAETMLGESLGKEFSALITGDDISRGKPDPAAFLEAARRLGIAPSDIVVVENAPLGAVAAAKAGMECFIALNNTPLRRTDFGRFVKAGNIFETTGSVLKHLEMIE